MAKIQKKVRILLPLFCLFLFSGIAGGSEKPHLQGLVVELKDGEAITKAFKDSTSGKAVDALLKKNRKVREKYLKEFNAGSAFARGEIEDEKTLNSVIRLLQLSILKFRTESDRHHWQDAQKELEAWFAFAADFPYEESSLIGLKVAGVIRSLLLDELEKVSQKNSDEIAKHGLLRAWFMNVRAPWPIDRMVISESKRALPPALMSIAEKVANKLQKSPYTTSAEALEQVPGAKPKDLDILKELWKPSHIGDMKAEITRIGKLQLQLAAFEYAQKNGKKALKAEELVTAKLLERIPIDYNTGRPMELGSQ